MSRNPGKHYHMFFIGYANMCNAFYTAPTDRSAMPYQARREDILRPIYGIRLIK